MKNTLIQLLLSLIFTISVYQLEAQQIRCIICPTEVSLSTIETGTAFATLTPSQPSSVTNSSDNEAVAVVTNNADDNLPSLTDDAQTCGDPTECGWLTEDDLNLVTKTFSVFPNPASHWLIVDRSELGEEDFTVFIKNVRDEVVVEQKMSKKGNAKVRLNIRNLAKGTYFVTLRQESNYAQWTKRITVR